MQKVKREERMRLKFKWPAVLIVAALTSPLQANLADSFGFAAEGVGRSGAGVATVNDWTSPYYNMAGLASPVGALKKKRPGDSAGSKIKLKRIKPGESDNKEKGEGPAEDGGDEYSAIIGFNYSYQLSSMTIDPAANSADINRNIEIATTDANYGIIQTGLVFDLRNVVNTYDDLPVKLGLAVAIRDNGTIATVTDTTVESYNFVRLGRGAQRLVLLSGLGAQVWKNRLSVGVGTSLFAGGKGKFSMSDVDINPDYQVPRQEVQLDLTPKIAPAAGIQYRHPVARDVFFGGFSYRGEIYMQLDPLEARATTGLLSVDLPLKLAILDFYTPHIFTLGGGWSRSDWLRVNLDIQMQLWQNFKLSSARVEYLKANNKQIPSFKNVYRPMLSGEFRPGQFLPALSDRPLWVRGGYALETSMINNSSHEANFLDSTKHILSLGAGYILPSNKVVKVPTELDFGVQMQFWNSVSVTKEPSIDSTVNPDYKYGAMVVVLALSASWEF